MTKESKDALAADILNQMSNANYRTTTAIRSAVKRYLEGASLNLYGEFGGGKSIFWKVLSGVKVRHNPTGSIIRPFYFAVIPMARVASFRLYEIRQWLCRYEDYELVVDDLGAEPLHVSYGMRSEVIDLILSMRESSPKRTHFTTNIPLESDDPANENTIARRYGERIRDRIAYASVISFTDKSRRGVGRFRLPMMDEENYRILHLAPNEHIEAAGIPDAARPKFNQDAE